MPPRPLILGTAGHIDHGKTALVRALTGVDTDRLPEEKARGISIDLGFARLDLGGHRLGIVDVPGHERFIRNMLAGASGIDLALLVIAADDSIMPQTREHLAILELLGIERGMIALTKCDLAEAGWLDLVEEEVRELVKDTFLAGAPIVRTSATTGAGLDDLRAALADVCAHADAGADADGAGEHFRLPVDRAFVLQGLGTVVTGTVTAGRAGVNDELELLPAGAVVRIRSLQSHGSDAQAITRGQRAAINLMGAHHSEIERGFELATPGWLKPSRRLTVHLRALAGIPWPIRHRSRARLHIGAQEVMVQIRLLSGRSLDGGAVAFAQLLAEEPVVAAGRQPFVLRSESPLVTIGGGRILQPLAGHLRRRDAEALSRLDELASNDDAARAAAAVWFYAHEPWTRTDLCRDARLAPARADALLAKFAQDGVIETVTLASRAERLLHRDVIARLCDRVVATLRALHADAPLEKAIPRPRLAARLEYLPEEVLNGLIDRLLKRQVLVGDDRSIAQAEFRPRLSDGQSKLRQAILDAFRAGAFSPPEPADIARQAGITDRQLKPILDLCAAEGTLVHVEGSLFLHAECHLELKQRMTAALSGGAGLTMSEIRQILDTSRKYAVPIGEHLDRIGLTVRKGDVRILKRQAAAADARTGAR